MAQARGARVWSTPWSPDSAIQKQHQCATAEIFWEHRPVNQAYANQQAGYVASMKRQYGVNLYAISVQNEPDAMRPLMNRACGPPSRFMILFPYLYNALAASNVASTKIMLPESQNWQEPIFTATAMSDPTVAADVGIIA